MTQVDRDKRAAGREGGRSRERHGEGKGREGRRGRQVVGGGDYDWVWRQSDFCLRFFSLSLSLIFVVLLQVELHHESCGLS